MIQNGNEQTWTTALTQVEPGRIRIRGYSVPELMGREGYASVLYLLVTGDLPGRSIARLLEAVLVSSMDHGATPPSTLAARTAASTGAPLNAALAAGLLSINEFHGGAIERCMAHLQGLEQLESEERMDRVEAARELVARVQKEGTRLAGFGHRVHRQDPRTQRLFDIAREEHLAGDWIRRVQELERALCDATGRELLLNVDGAIAAVLCEIGLDPGLANGIFMIARLPGLLAHVIEERATQRPMRRIVPGSDRYNGAPARTLDSVSDPEVREGSAEASDE